MLEIRHEHVINNAFLHNFSMASHSMDKRGGRCPEARARRSTEDSTLPHPSTQTLFQHSIDYFQLLYLHLSISDFLISISPFRLFSSTAQQPASDSLYPGKIILTEQFFL